MFDKINRSLVLVGMALMVISCTQGMPPPEVAPSLSVSENSSQDPALGDEVRGEEVGGENPSPTPAMSPAEGPPTVETTPDGDERSSDAPNAAPKGEDLPSPYAYEESPEFPRLMNDQVRRWIDYYTTEIPEQIQLYLDRKPLYEPMIRQKLVEAGLPEDLIYAAFIESGMNPRAYSRAAAVGMWQFIAGTAVHYDMEISFFHDERRDPEKSTDSAIKYMKEMYDEFGSWLLVLAGYNGGPGRVRRALRRAPGADFWELSRRGFFRRETRDHIPKILAAAHIGSDPEKYGFSTEGLEPVEYEVVEIPDATSFDILAEVAGTDQETIRHLNPQFPRRVTPPNRAIKVKIPAAGAEGFEARYAAVPVNKRVTWTYHVVQSGHTLGWIGQQYGVSVAALRAANGNVNPRRLQIGQRLVVPNPARVGGS